MISKKIILKSIDEALIKCSQTKFFSRNTINNFNKFHDKTQGLNHEKAQYINRDGEVIWESNNNDEGNTNVHLNMKFIRESLQDGSVDGASVDIIHNHPTIPTIENLSYILSPSDLRVLISSNEDGGKSTPYLLFRSTTSICDDGSRMSIILKNDAKKTLDTVMVSEDMDRFQGFLKATDHYEDVLKTYLSDYSGKVREYYNLSTGDLLDKFNNHESLDEEGIRRSVHESIISEIGDFESYLNKNGVIGEFDDLGYLFKIQKSPPKKIK